MSFRCPVIALLLFCSMLASTRAAAPTDNPVAKYKLSWTEEIPWQKVIAIEDVKGDSMEQRLHQAQKELAFQGGGVVFFPAGVYKFKDHIHLLDGIILRGETPKNATDAQDDNYTLATRFEFPQYVPKLSGNGTPIDTAFKGIYLANPEKASNCGLVNIALNRGHIRFLEGDDKTCGKNRLVYGCVLRNAAVADANVPSKKIGQHAWQRFTSRHHAAVHIKSAENALIANNRLPKSGDDNFRQKGYILQVNEKGKRVNKAIDQGVLFDYDNRPGMYINDYGIGSAGGNGPAGTPKTHPWGFRKGVEIRDNYIYCSGRCAIAFCGDGVICSNNVIRFPEGLERWTATGLQGVTGSSTNDNRAVQMRGYRWVVEGNDYIVHSNIAMPSRYRINDGEGLMHEAHVNSAIKDSKLINNKGNAYLSLYRVRGIDGLLIKGNHIRSKGRISAIFVLSSYHKEDFPARNVIIEDNVTENSGILIEGRPGEDCMVRNNRHIGSGGVIVNNANAKLSGNQNYEVKRNVK